MPTIGMSRTMANSDKPIFVLLRNHDDLASVAGGDSVLCEGDFTAIAHLLIKE